MDLLTNQRSFSYFFSSAEWISNPILVTIETTDFPIENIIFPTVTVCRQVKFILLFLQTLTFPKGTQKRDPQWIQNGPVCRITRLLTTQRNRVYALRIYLELVK